MKLLEFDDFEAEQERREAQMVEPEVDKHKTYIYTVHEDDEETGNFHADVRGVDGTIIFEITKKDFPEPDENGEIEEAEEGAPPRMKDVNDLKGLRDVLLAKGKIKENDVVTSNEIYAQHTTEQPTQTANTNLMENKKKLNNFDKFLNENFSEQANENEQGSGNKFILMRFGNTPDNRVTQLFSQIASGRPTAMRAPGAIMTIFQTGKTKEQLVESFDGLGISYDLYQVVHTSRGTAGNAASGHAQTPQAMSVDQLKAALRKALADDKFEEAARLRDEIAQREGRPAGAPEVGNTTGTAAESEETIFSAINMMESVRAMLPETYNSVKEQFIELIMKSL